METMEAPGVIKTLSPEERSFYEPEDIQRLLGVGRSKAYDMIKSTVRYCVKMGYLADDYPPGQVPKKYFNPRYGLD